MRLAPRSLVPMLCVVLGVLAVGFAAPAGAANCNATPCHCGDEITVSKTLVPGIDPVVSGEACTGTGLFVNGSDVTLDLSGGQMTGSLTSTTGIDATGDRVTIKHGRLSGFATGVTVKGIDGHVTDLLIIRTRTAGVVVTGFNGGTGDNANVERSEIRGGGTVGIKIEGNNATVFLNRVDPYTTGIDVAGDGATINRNLVYRNGTGIRVCGSGADMNLNSVKYCTGDGIVLECGGGHTLNRNISSYNGGDGFKVSAPPGSAASVLTRNTGNADGNDADGGVGFRDTTTGSGTKGTANTYSLNICSAKVGHKSDPLGLCR
jgi:hypothetical protein